MGLGHVYKRSSQSFDWEVKCLPKNFLWKSDNFKAVEENWFFYLDKNSRELSVCLIRNKNKIVSIDVWFEIKNSSEVVEEIQRKDITARTHPVYPKYDQFPLESVIVDDTFTVSLRIFRVNYAQHSYETPSTEGAWETYTEVDHNTGVKFVSERVDDINKEEKHHSKSEEITGKGVKHDSKSVDDTNEGIKDNIKNVNVDNKGINTDKKQNRLTGTKGVWETYTEVNHNTGVKFISERVKHYNERVDGINKEEKHRSKREEDTGKGVKHDSKRVNDTNKGVKGLVTLSENLKDLFLHGEESDLTIEVQGAMYPVHRMILRARSPVFSAMLKHDMKEKNKGVINIPDCDSCIFGHFLLYLYTGKSDQVSEENVFHLYEISDKYGVKELIEVCTEFMLQNLSVDVIVDVLSLALKHSESELLKCATEFFIENAAYILETVKWQKFVEENPIQANELFIKTVKKAPK